MLLAAELSGGSGADLEDPQTPVGEQVEEEEAIEVEDSGTVQDASRLYTEKARLLLAPGTRVNLLNALELVRSLSEMLCVSNTLALQDLYRLQLNMNPVERNACLLGLGLRLAYFDPNR